ncbi:protein-methionine-sulfoxide reductase heme-binding subunit MsrQ [Alteromonas flava]|uniref:protein-methionine-sulfoxide reductase heme-binding subunit MsrQ n=1 Tax=Alteromonas flava TaxID=2048003 RepID=UPI000C294B09|nr:protein-methionine-sulfoxide reductase heme-binding subunit MsrQ [Alteromonas flava]
MSIPIKALNKRTPIRLSPVHILVLKLVIHGICLGMLGNILYLAIYDKIPGDPVDALLHFSGISAVNMLLFSLLLSPVAKGLKMGMLISLRRVSGLYALFFATLHIITFVAFELQFEWTLIGREIIERPFITVGLVAWLLLILLAVTSVNTLKRKMGRTWQQLHNWVYLAALLAVIHYYWSVKSGFTEPLLYIVAVAALLYLRREKLLKHLRR